MKKTYTTPTMTRLDSAPGLNPPDRIWLQVGSDNYTDYYLDTWCADQIAADDIPYVRDQWIDVRAQTPASNEFVLVVIDLAGCKLQMIGWHQNYWTWYGREFTSRATVTHWRPLPAFPAVPTNEEEE
jgi:hypothetical protein